MNKTEYSQACLFRVREALETAQAWWEHEPKLTHRKIERTVDMLEDIIDELKYFHEKMENPTEEPVNADDRNDTLEYGSYDPDFSDHDSAEHQHAGLYLR